jgi:undecaprenyl diphosphate synthase
MTENEIISRGVPTHIAIILDGNGRWAKKRLMPRTFGHRKGAFNIRDVARYANKIGIKYMTVYCFSTENWKRPSDEVNYLMTKPVRYIKRYRDSIINSTTRIKMIGRRDRLPKDLLETIEDIENITKDHTGLTLTLCVDYGALDEVKNAVLKMHHDLECGKLKESEVTDNTIYNYLYTNDLPPVDLLIRTSGEIRLSNYLLLQLAYSELYFTDVYWPDFNDKELLKAIENYQNRNRRFGGLKETK